MDVQQNASSTETDSSSLLAQRRQKLKKQTATLKRLRELINQNNKLLFNKPAIPVKQPSQNDIKSPSKSSSFVKKSMHQDEPENDSKNAKKEKKKKAPLKEKSFDHLEIVKLKRTVSDLQKQVEELGKKSSAVEPLIDAKVHRIQNKLDRRQSLQNEKLQKMGLDCKRLENAMDKMNMNLMSWRHSFISERTDTPSTDYSTEERLTTLQADIDKIKRNYNNIEKTIGDKIENQLAKANIEVLSQYNELKDKLHMQNIKVEELRDFCEQIRKEQHTYRRELKSNKEKDEDFQKLLDSLTGKIDFYAKRVSEFQQRFERLVLDVQDLSESSKVALTAKNMATKHSSSPTTNPTQQLVTNRSSINRATTRKANSVVSTSSSSSSASSLRDFNERYEKLKQAYYRVFRKRDEEE